MAGRPQQLRPDRCGARDPRSALLPGDAGERLRRAPGSAPPGPGRCISRGRPTRARAGTGARRIAGRVRGRGLLPQSRLCRGALSPRRPGGRAPAGPRMVSLARWGRAQEYERGYWVRQAAAIAEGAAAQLDWYRWRADRLVERLRDLGLGELTT